MSEEEEEQLAGGLNMLHDQGSVHASDLQHIIKVHDVVKRKKLEALTGITTFKLFEFLQYTCMQALVVTYVLIIL